MQSYRVAWTGPGVAGIEPFALPSPAEGQLLLHTRLSLISPGTERAFFLGLPNTSQQYPQYPGYNAIGDVLAVGAGVDPALVGQRVACASPHAMHALVAAGACLPVPDNAADDQAVFFNMVAIAMQGVRKARIELGEPVAVVGAGLVGLLALQLARANGALPAIAIDHNEHRLAFARQAGADAALLADQQAPGALTDMCDGDGAAVVIEATGSPEAVLLACRLARPFGRVVLLGSTRGATEQVDFYTLVHRRGLTLIGAHDLARPRYDSAPGWWAKRDDQRLALRLIAMQRLVLAPLMTHRFAWPDAPEAYALLSQWDARAVGMLIDWRTVPA